MLLHHILHPSPAHQISHTVVGVVVGTLLCPFLMPNKPQWIRRCRRADQILARSYLIDAANVQRSCAIQIFEEFHASHNGLRLIIHCSIVYIELDAHRKLNMAMRFI